MSLENSSFDFVSILHSYINLLFLNHLESLDSKSHVLPHIVAASQPAPNMPLFIVFSLIVFFLGFKLSLLI